MIRVAIIAFEGMSLFHLSVPIAIFADAPAQNTANNTPLFEVTVCAESEGAIRSANGERHHMGGRSSWTSAGRLFFGTHTACTT